MPSLARLVAFVALLASVSAIVPPGQQGSPNQPIDVSENDAPTTDTDSIVQTAGQVDQKSSPPIDAPPSSDVPPTTVTALDGALTNATVSEVSGSSNTTSTSTRRSVGRLGQRTSGFTKVFDGLPAGKHDASIQGTAYLTYTVVDNSTYNVQACLDWCTQRVDGCVFVNIFYEFNNYLLDFVFSEKSNLKCAAYGDIHNATEKLNFGGQPSYPQVGDAPVPLTYITQSSGYAVNSLVNPSDPDGYDLVFGPTGGANNAPGYMGFAFLDKYDVDACAQLCNGRGVDPVGGGCSYFNIWRAVVNGVPTTYTCSMYYLVADESTAVNYGQGSLVVTLSRGYARKNLVIDGGFEGYTGCSDFCFTASYSNWIGTSLGNLDASVFHFQPYSHFGSGVALFGAAFGDDSLAGTLKPAKPLVTEKGASYVIQAFFISSFSGPSLEAHAKVDVFWNGKRVGGTSGFVGSYTFTQSTVVTGTGSDLLSFVGGAAPAWTFLDDVKVFKV
ncbi:hypothetical protein MIND_00610700 [Mycena indigotica]|uniref:Fruit-body specific protein a n=1 Tax=Mycena indigotica TaxID=2126181 RepID=A0A8H6SRP8_9AGAR|nr:uncharacterized protein MIND_00610700 [Mycena indigotica]KAF7303810.1 hypothetical protein MIND_00610700 [Mycena indigotica]